MKKMIYIRCAKLYFVTFYFRQLTVWAFSCNTSNKMTITVYGAYRSTCTKRVLTTLHEKGLKFEFQPIDLTKGEQKVRVEKS